MRTTWLRSLFGLLACVLVGSAAIAETEGTPANTSKPLPRADVSPEELALWLQPLRKEALRAEADVWAERVQSKAEQVSEALIALNALSADGAGSDVSKARVAAQTELVAELRAERTRAIDNLRTVVDALEAKTDAEDAETRAQIRDLRLYMSGAGGILVSAGGAEATWKAFTSWLSSEEGGLRWAWNLALFLGILFAARLAAALVRGVLRKALQRVDSPELLEDFLIKTGYWVTMLAGVMVALSALEVSMGPLLAMVGAAGFIVAFAMQDSLSNLASGLLILLFRPFDTGDVVEAAGVSGKVESMNLIATTIMTFDNKRMIVPNNSIVGDVITNATGVGERRVDLEFGIGYDDDVDRAHAVLEEIVFAHELVLEEPAPVIRLATLADSSVNFIVRPWVRTSDYWTVHWDLTRAVKQRFDAEGIGIPYPQQDVHVHWGAGSDRPEESPIS